MKQFHYWLTSRYEASAWARLAVILGAVLLSNLLIWPVMAFVSHEGWMVFFSLAIIVGVAAYFSWACTCYRQEATGCKADVVVEVDMSRPPFFDPKSYSDLAQKTPHNYG